MIENNQNFYISPYARQERLKKSTNNNLGSIALGLCLLAGSILTVNNSLKDPDVEFKGESIYIVQPYDGINSAAMAVNRDPNQIPYRVVVDEIEKNTKNEEVLKDGLQPGEILYIPDSVELAD